MDRCKSLIGLSVLMALALPAVAEEPPLTAPTDWRRTFSEDFDRLDLSRWTTHYPWGGRLQRGRVLYRSPGETPRS